MGIVKAKVWISAPVSVGVEYSFAVEIESPVAMPIKTYRITLYEVLSRTYSKVESTKVILNILAERVLNDYNACIEDSPILDMFEHPDRYEKCSSIQFERTFATLEHTF